jgi:hypothetical protein
MFDIRKYIEYKENLHDLFGYISSANFDEYIKDPIIDIMLDKCKSETPESSNVIRCIETLEHLKTTGTSSRHILLDEDIHQIIEKSFNPTILDSIVLP